MDEFGRGMITGLLLLLALGILFHRPDANDTVSGVRVPLSGEAADCITPAEADRLVTAAEQAFARDCVGEVKP